MESYSNILFLRDRNSIYMGILWRLLLHRGWNPTSWNLRGMKCEAFGNAADYSANREHPCSAYAKFSEKHISYSLIRTRTYVVYQEVKVCFFCFFFVFVFFFGKFCVRIKWMVSYFIQNLPSFRTVWII